MVSICSLKVGNVSRSPTDQSPHELLACSDTYRRQWCECSWSARPEEGMVSNNRAGADRTHVEDNEDPVEIGVPGGNGLLVISRMKKSRGRIATALFDDFFLYFPDGPVIEVEEPGTVVSVAQLTSSADLSHRTPTG